MPEATDRHPLRRPQEDRAPRGAHRREPLREPLPERVVVTGPPRLPPPRQPTSVRTEIDEQTLLGEVYMRSLISTQLRLGLLVMVVVHVLLLPLPLMFAYAPSVSHRDVLGTPLPWLLLGVVVFPVVVLVAVLYRRQSERAERAFAQLVARQQPR